MNDRPKPERENNKYIQHQEHIFNCKWCLWDRKKLFDFIRLEAIKELNEECKQEMHKTKCRICGEH